MAHKNQDQITWCLHRAPSIESTSGLWFLAFSAYVPLLSRAERAFYSPRQAKLEGRWQRRSQTLSPRNSSLCSQMLSQYLMTNYAIKYLFCVYSALLPDFFSLSFLGDDLWPAVIVSVVCFIPLVVMRASRNLVAPPIVIITDSKEFAFNFPTRYRIDVSKIRNIHLSSLFMFFTSRRTEYFLCLTTSAHDKVVSRASLLWRA